LIIHFNQEAMDAKLTLSFNEEVVKKAKNYAANHNISLSRLVEHLLIQVTDKP
jgi:predicted HicB family RNase H-like nuclease